MTLFPKVLSTSQDLPFRSLLSLQHSSYSGRCSLRATAFPSLLVMDAIAAAFVIGLSIGVGLGYRFCQRRTQGQITTSQPSQPEVQHRRRPDIPLPHTGGPGADWQYMLTREEALDEGSRTTTWKSMSWCHSDVLEYSLDDGLPEVEIWSHPRKSWVVNFDRMEQMSTSSARVRLVRRRLLCEH